MNGDFYQGTPWFKPGSQQRPMHRKPPIFSQAELEEKRKKAIADEAAKKAKKVVQDQIKNEARWIELGRAICALSPADFGLDTPAENPEEMTGDEIIWSVHSSVEHMKKMLGDQAVRGTVFANCFGLTSSLCRVNQKAVVYMDQRIVKMRMQREEAARKEELARQMTEDRWIEIGRAICSLTPENVGIASEANSEAPESTKRVRKRTKRSPSAESMTWRGEDVVENVFNFSSGLRDLMSIYSRHTCFKSPFEFTSVITDVAEKSVRDRHPVRRVPKRRKEDKEEDSD